MRHPYRRRRFFIGPFILLALLGVTFVVYWLWNNVLTAVTTAVRPVTYWQALGLLILFRILLGGFKFGSPVGRTPYNRANWGEKWRQMSDEDRTKFKEEWKRRWHKGS